MTTINTSLNCYASRLNGRIEIPPDSGFASMAQLGLLLGMADPETRQLPTDEQGLKDAARRLDYLFDDCLDGLRGIGGLLRAANPEGMSEDCLSGLGRLIENISALAQAVMDGREQLAKDRRFLAILRP